MRIILSFVFGLIWIQSVAQKPGYWQQEVDYEMEIKMDVKTNRFEGVQKLTYTNHSPDTLDRVFYHLYFNAFQPESMMDVRSRTIMDPDSRVGDRISKLGPDEIGYQKIHQLEQDGNKVEYREEGTILVVELDQPILPGEQSVFDMVFEAQVPLQIRRTGRDNLEGIRYSMSQWFPKISEYDERGWHPTPYIGREFHSVWGNYDVKIEIDKDYIVAATGHLVNADKIGYGYTEEEVDHSGKNTLTWHFVAENVLDFVWAADPDYVHKRHTASNGVEMHFFYQEGDKTAAWEDLPEIMAEVMDYAEKHFGKYMYDRYSFIQGGDGGMEYPMATLITGHRSITSLTGVSVHEIMHSWYQHILATNESLYPWMDEGFTSYGSTRIMNHLKEKGLLPGEPEEDPFASNYERYAQLVHAGLEEPLTTHADHYHTNVAYGVAAYVKGAIFLHQLEYILGKEVFDRVLHRYYNTWKFKHPTDLDFIRVAEKESGLILDWYYEYWVQTTKFIDYGIESVEKKNNSVDIHLTRKGLMPMPIDVYITRKDGSTDIFTIPLRMMRGSKKQDAHRNLLHAEAWPWVNTEYTLTVDIPLEEISEIEIDRSGRLADVNLDDNRWINED